MGQALHEEDRQRVDGWPWERFGWAQFTADGGGIDDRVAQMGKGSGWAALDATQKTQMRALIRQAGDPGGVWGPKVTPDAPPAGPWCGANFGPHLAFEMSGETWCDKNDRCYRAGGKAFAVDFWYGTPMCVAESTLDFIDTHMPSATPR